MNYDPIECGMRITHLRAEYGITQTQAAEELNISVQHYRAIEAGRRSASIELLVEISITYQSSLDYLIFGRSTAAHLGEFKVKLDSVISTLKAMERTL